MINFESLPIEFKHVLFGVPVNYSKRSMLDQITIITIKVGPTIL